MTSPPEWVTAIPAVPEIHNEPAGYQWRGLSQTELEGLRGGLIGGIVSAIVEVLTGFFDPGVDALQQLLAWTENIPIVGDLIADLIRGLIPIPVGGLSETQENLLPDGTFAAGSIDAAANPGWSVDTGTTRTADGSGAAKVVANGTRMSLRTGRTASDKIRAAVGQRLTGTVYVRHQGFTGTGDAVLLQIAPYSGGVLGEFVTLDRYTPTSTDLMDWPGHQMTGEYTLPSGVDAVQMRVTVAAAATGGTFWFDDASVKLPTSLQQSQVGGLLDALEEIIARAQLLLDSLFQGLTGADSLSNTFSDLIEALLNINPDNVSGVAGPASIGDSILGLLDSLLGGLVGEQGSGGSLADLFNISKIISGRASQGSNAWEILGQRNNTPVDSGLLPSSEANYNLSVVNTSLTATPTASLIATMRVQRSAPLGVVSWLGCGTSGLTALYLHIRKIDPADGDRVLVHSSPNIVGNLVAGTTPGWEFYSPDPPLARVAGEDYEYEWVPVGANHTIRGINLTDTVPDHPYAHVISLGASRDSSGNPSSPPSTIAKASVTTSGSIPWVETAIDTGSTSDYYDPITVYLTLDTTVPIPNWCAYVDAVGLGAGGDGTAGFSFGFGGEPGEPGRFNATTWERDTHFTDGDIVEAHPAEDDSEDTTLAIQGTAYTLTALSGEDGSGAGFLGQPVGEGPGSLTYQDETYAGGGDQSAWGGDGAAPGGAGNGGHWLTGFLSGGGVGAKGAAWVRFRPGVIEGGGIPLDTTPPTAPTVELVSATRSTITVTATGATD